MSKGRFDVVNVRVVDDTAGEKGRSAARNQAVDSSKAEWLFFLDADDVIHPEAFENVGLFLDGFDAIWGNIYELNAGVVAWRWQVPRIATYEQLLAFDPYLTLQMGHFVKREHCLKFNEEMNTGEDWDYYLRMWREKRCAKIDRAFFINQRGQHSTGPKAANGREWGEVVRPMIERARSELK